MARKHVIAATSGPCSSLEKPRHTRELTARPVARLQDQPGGGRGQGDGSLLQLCRNRMLRISVKKDIMSTVHVVADMRCVGCLL